MPESSESGKTFTQEELDDIVKERLQRERSKYADYSELSKKAKAYDDQQEANSSALEKLTKRAEDAESKLTAYEKEKEHSAMVKKVMDEQHVDAKYASLLTASDEEGLTEQAKLVAERFADPVPSDTGKQPSLSTGTDAKQFAHDLFGGKN